MGDVADFSYARSIKEAESLLQAHENNYDLVILDLGLPDGSGVQLLDKLNPYPVVIFSGEEADTDIAEQVDAFLMKSKTSNEQLLETIKQAITSQQHKQE